MKQTAVEWLYGKSKLRELDKFDLEQAKEMEKEQIIVFAVWFNNRNNEYQSYDNIVEQYYKETFKSE